MFVLYNDGATKKGMKKSIGGKKTYQYAPGSFSGPKFFWHVVVHLDCNLAEVCEGLPKICLVRGI